VRIDIERGHTVSDVRQESHVASPLVDCGHLARSHEGSIFEPIAASKRTLIHPKIIAPWVSPLCRTGRSCPTNQGNVSGMIEPATLACLADFRERRFENRKSMCPYKRPYNSGATRIRLLPLPSVVGSLTCGKPPVGYRPAPSFPAHFRIPKPCAKVRILPGAPRLQLGSAETTTLTDGDRVHDASVRLGRVGQDADAVVLEVAARAGNSLAFEPRVGVANAARALANRYASAGRSHHGPTICLREEATAYASDG
jgi:hypothetical protein